MKEIIKNLIPPVFLHPLNWFFKRKWGWKGNYKSWNEAESVSSGYDTEDIIEKVRSSLLRVKNNEAVYERDSVIFDEIQYSWPLLTGLMYAAASSGGELRVLDFGGSLGSTYFQNKKFLDNFEHISWSIVEQKHFVDVGKEDFEDERLKFFYSIDECMRSQKPAVLLLSSVIQYIKEPYSLLGELLKTKFDFIVIDRTSFNLENGDKIKLQIVPPSIYSASYPCHFLDKLFFLDFFNKHGYTVVEGFECLEGRGRDYSFEGMILKKVRYVC